MPLSDTRALLTFNRLLANLYAEFWLVLSALADKNLASCMSITIFGPGTAGRGVYSWICAIGGTAINELLHLWTEKAEDECSGAP
jgi:hypothetical protein